MSTLSVETSNRGSSTSTRSPTCFSHRVTVPSVTLSPRAGICTESDIDSEISFVEIAPALAGGRGSVCRAGLRSGQCWARVVFALR